MVKILVVDDEPTVSTGIKSYLMRSELGIDHVETASNGFEALDCLRMDTYDLVLTDIQMGMMNGIELMEAILLEQPHLPVIVISAHEKFDFAKRALRLGAKDYLIKPVELDELMRVVGKALQEKKELGRLTLQRPDVGATQDVLLLKKRHEALIELVTETDLQDKDYEDLLREIGSSLKDQGHWYGIAAVHLNLSKGGFSNQEITLMDRKLLKYASVNILEESLSDWCGVAFYGFGNQLVCVIQLEATDSVDARLPMNSQLNLIGQTIIFNLKQYLNVDVTVGMSTLSLDLSMLPRLMEEANAAIEWRKLHPDNHVLYYEDMSALGNMRMIEWADKVEELVLHMKTVDEVQLSQELQSAVKILSNLSTHSEGLFHSCFGLLVYRLYGLLFDNGQESSSNFRQFDPDVYFRGMEISRKVASLHAYVQGLSEVIQACISERDQTVVSRISAYIYNHYGNHELKIQDIAGEVHFSAAYVSYLFKRETNKNVWDFVSEVRIEEAKRLLAVTDLKRYEISYQVGYQSPEHFSRMFKRFIGISPADYRKEIRGN
ncbi:response regulator [Paenibacillus qinlingensis]|uniref:Two-component system response regulator YesN n=1 Tax=Paenibacillus qinlingensis TaxID=1837343 RepID=A0ABU1NUP9_9BACL|nr:response regulator [Paenibacillus qinlingensis]MDR6551059.1 two-component system response regulator YesN [Paenibacillus qinlingensis]